MQVDTDVCIEIELYGAGVNTMLAVQDNSHYQGIQLL